MTHPSRHPGSASVRRGTADRVREFVEGRTGLVWLPGRDEQLLQIFREVAADFRLSPSEFLRDLTAGRGGSAFDALLGRVVTHETYFFRDPAQLDVLRRRVLPERLACRAGAGLRLWSAGCSTGEEAYTLAFVLRQVLGEEVSAASSVTGTDLDPEALETARGGVYGSRSFRETSPEPRSRWFLEQGPERWRVRRPYVSRVRFLRHNLVRGPMKDPSAGLADLDVILCRNVTQYFRPQTARLVATTLLRLLAPGGYLLVGHAEYNRSVFSGFETVYVPGAVLYQRPMETSAGKPDRRGERGREIRRGEAALQEALAHYNAKRYEEAAAILRRLGVAERDGAVAYWLGRIEADRGRRREAADLLRRSLEMDPLNLEARYLLAILDRERGEVGRALAHLRKILFLQPDHLPALYGMARCLVRQGRSREAESCLARVRSLLEGMDDGQRIGPSERLTVAELRAALEVRG